jgi:acyl-coenzyme A synthetase/AMP-(fatty) acid ligase
VVPPVMQFLALHKQLGDVVLCDTIPKTAVGKILRRVLRQQDAGRTGA